MGRVSFRMQCGRSAWLCSTITFLAVIRESRSQRCHGIAELVDQFCLEVRVARDLCASELHINNRRGGSAEHSSDHVCVCVCVVCVFA